MGFMMNAASAAARQMCGYTRNVLDELLIELLNLG